MLAKISVTQHVWTHLMYEHILRGVAKLHEEFHMSEIFFIPFERWSNHQFARRSKHHYERKLIQVWVGVYFTKHSLERKRKHPKRANLHHKNMHNPTVASCFVIVYKLFSMFLVLQIIIANHTMWKLTNLIITQLKKTTTLTEGNLNSVLPGHCPTH